jgi:HPt (histidine-containing phosphotransfer) domain-containing protein
VGAAPDDSMIAQQLPLAADAVATSQTASLADLEGFDVDAALGRMNGNERLYRKLLLGLVDNNAGDAVAIRGALEAGDYEIARRTTHTLRGVSGNLGALELFAATSRLEAAIAALAEHGESPDISALMQQMSDCLDRDMERVRLLVGAAPADQAHDSAADDAPIDCAAAAALALRLREAAAIGDLTELEEVLRELPDGSGYRRDLGRMLEGFDMDGVESLAADLDKVATR